MRLIFIRHGDPDYKNDSLTKKGWKEAKLLSERVKKWNVTKFFVSPFGRAQATASLSLKKKKMEGETLEWLREFYIPVKDPVTGKDRLPWDFMPSYYSQDERFFDKDKWLSTPVMQSGPTEARYKEVSDGIDEVLLRYGFTRDGLIYKTDGSIENPNFNPQIEKYQLVTNKKVWDDRTLVFVCHLGAMFAAISHLINMSPFVLWHNFYVAPTSITVLNVEERERGKTAFRIERLGDTSHLYKGKEKISSSGYFTDLLDESK